jgi:hypothetical protein
MPELVTKVFGSQKEVRVNKEPCMEAVITSMCPIMQRTTLITRNFLAPFGSQTMVEKKSEILLSL